MGTANSKHSSVNLSKVGPLLYETQGFAKWTVEDVRRLHWQFKHTVHGLALVEPQFECVMAFKKEAMGTNVSLPAMFRVIDNDNDGRIDALEFMGGLALVCRGTFEDKARLCFELFDFNMTADLSKSELVMMMQSTVCGMLCLSGGSEEMEPDLEVIEALADEAFLIADTDKNQSIAYNEFVVWARSNRDIMSCLENIAQVNSQAIQEETDDSAEEASDVEDTGIDAEAVPEERSAQREALNKDMINAEEYKTSGDQFTAVKAFVGAIFEPSDYKKAPDSRKLPDSNLEIEWVHGYRGFDCRNNLRYVVRKRVEGAPNNNINNINNNKDRDLLAHQGEGQEDSRCIVYPTAALGVVYDLKSNTQRFYHGHTDDIISLALHPAGSIVATGQIGREPVIHVWDSNSMRCLSSISGFHQRGVCQVAFSADGSKLASVGLDNDHSVSLHDWETGTLLASGLGHQNKVLGLAFSPSGKTIAIVGVKFVKFFTVEGRALVARSGLLKKLGKIQTFCSVAFLGEDAVVGTAGGQLYKFSGGELSQVVQAHGNNEPVLSLYAPPDSGQLLSGGKDGLIMTWDLNLKVVGNAVDVPDIAVTDKKTDAVITADCAIVSVHIQPGHMLVGTRGGQIIEIEMTKNAPETWKARTLMTSHATGELWGLDTHPVKGEFATSGEDKTVRTWSLRRLRQLKIRALPCPSQAVAYSACGKHLAIGMTTGAMAVMDDGLEVVITSWQHSQRPISDIKYAPNGTSLAVASKDCNIYIYSVDIEGKKYSRRAVCSGHASTVSHLDFSMDSNFLQSTSNDYELLFWQSSGNIYRFASKLRDVQWATWTCTLGWPVQGIWPQGADGTDVNTVDRDMKLGVLATGDDAGRIKLFRYPCVDKGAMFQAYRGHSSHVTKVRFTNDHRFLISLGGNDKSIIQWRHDVEDLDSNSSEGEEEDMEEIKNIVHINAHKVDRSPLEDAVKNCKTSTELVELIKGPHSGGDEFGAVKPWVGAIVPPTKANSNKNDASTDVDLQLGWVYGYRSQDCRNNVRYSSGGDIVYMAAALGVVYHKNKNTQSFLQGAHTDDIISMAIHPNGKIVATGEVGRKPKIVVWDLETKDVKAILDGFHKRAVSLLAFDRTGNYIASVGLDDDHSMAIYHWAQRRLVASGPTDKSKVLGLTFLSPPGVTSTPGSTITSTTKTSPVTNGVIECDRLVTCGENHIKFWQVNGRNLNCQKGVFGSGKEKKRTMTGVVNMDHFAVSSSIDGTLSLWEEHKLISVVSSSPGSTYTVEGEKGVVVAKPQASAAGGEANKENNKGSPVQSMFAFQEEGKHMLVTGDKKGVIQLWELKLDCPISQGKTNQGQQGPKPEYRLVVKYEFHAPAKNGMDQAVRSVCFRKGLLLVGTASAEIYETHLGRKDSEGKLTWTCITQGHYKGELWGLAVHPTKRMFATGGDDNTVRLWEVDKRVQLGYRTLNEKVRALAYRHDGRRLAAGLYDGSVVILDHEDIVLNPDSKTSSLQNLPKKAKGWIQEVKYSPEGSFLAVGSHDRCIYLYSVTGETAQQYELIATCKRHSSYITHLDFGVLLTEKGEDPSMAKIGLDGKLYIRGQKPRPIKPEELVMQSTCGAYELLFWGKSPQDKEGHKAKSSQDKPLHPLATQQPSATKFRDVVWATWTSVLGWPVQGIWPAESDGTDINAVDRNHIHDKVPVLAVADDFGRVQLFHYPCVSKRCFDKTYRGHSSHVTNIRFTYDDGHVISTGGNDSCILVWKTDCIEEAREVDLAQERDEEWTLDERPPLIAKEEGVEAESHSPSHHDNDTIDDVPLPLKPPGGGDEMTATRAWTGSIREPSNYRESKDPASWSPPIADLEPAFVYGYRSQDVRNNCFYGSVVSEVLYHTAAVGIVYDSVKHKQRYNLSHTDDIISLAAYPKNNLVATGELGHIPKIVIWDSNSGNTLKVISGFHRKGVQLLAFSASGRFLASIGMDDDHSIAIYSLDKETLVGKEKVDRAKTMAVAYGGDSEVVVVGAGFVKFFTLNEKSAELKSKKGLFGKGPQGQENNNKVLSVAFLNSDVITGQQDGSIYLWKGRTITKVEKTVHKLAVNTLFSCTDATADFVSGGADGLVVLWSSALEALKRIDMAQLPRPPLNVEVRSVCAMQNCVLVGTKSSEIMEINTLTQQVDIHVQGHFKDELWGLSCHPAVCQVATVGDEGTVRVWDALQRNIVHMKDLKAKARALCYSPSGQHLAVALYAGDLVVLSEDLTNIIVQTNVSKTWIQAMTYSPDGRTLAVGSHDGSIYLLNAINYSRRAVCRGHSSAITHLDFSSDSLYLQSNCQAYELLFWDVKKGEQIKSATSLRDVQWATWSLVIGWPVQGIWPPETDGTDINAVHRSANGQALVTADDFGKVKLFRYPCVNKKAGFKQYGGHCSHVTNTQFAKEDKFVFTVGGMDRTIIQWAFHPQGIR